MNAPRPLPCCPWCAEPSAQLYDAPDDSSELACGECVDRYYRGLCEGEPTTDDEDNHGPDYAPDVHGRW